MSDWSKPHGYYTDKVFTPADIESAVLAEREACEKECVKVALRFFKACDDLEQFGADECAAAIRARGEK